MIRRVWINLMFFQLGAASLIGQMSLLREYLVVAEGNELSLSYYFFFWFAGVSLGAATGGRSAGIVQQRHWWFVFWMTSAALLLWVQLGVVRSLRFLFDIPAGEFFPLHTFLLGAMLGVFPFSFLVGLLFPFAGRIVERPEDPTTSAADGYSLLYVLEALGSLCAGLLFTFWLAGRYDHPVMLKGISIALAGTGLVLLLLKRFGTTTPDRLRLWSIAGAVLFFILFPADRFEQASQQARWRVQYPGLESVEIRTTPYGRLDLGRLENQYNLYVNGAFAAAFPDPFGALEPVHCAMVQSPDPKRVLLVGGSLDAALMVLQYPIRQLDWVELDPEVIRIQMQYHETGRKHLEDETRLRIHSTDGRRFLQTTTERYDLILLDVPPPLTVQLNRYYTREFFENVLRRLSPQGAVALSIRATMLPEGREIQQLSRTIHSTLTAVFPYLVVRPGESYWFYAAAHDGVLTDRPEVMATRYEQSAVLPVEYALFFPDLFQPDRVRRLQDALTEGPVHRPNSDRRPFALNRQLALSFLLSEGGWISIVGILCALMIVLLLIGLELQPFLRQKTRGGLDSFLATAIVGHAGMSIELVLLILFQNRLGVLYEGAALLVGLFMFGAATGAATVRRRIIRNRMTSRSLRILLERLLILFILFSLLLIAWIHIESSLLTTWAGVYYFGVLLNGLLTGAVFPVCLYLYILSGVSPVRAAGRIDASDHLGAMVASLLVYPLLLPMLGVGSILLLQCALLGALYLRLLRSRSIVGLT